MLKINIRVEYQYDGSYHAIDDLTYDVDCDLDGYFSTSASGWSKESPWDAARDLIDQLEDEHAEAAETAKGT